MGGMDEGSRPCGSQQLVSINTKLYQFQGFRTGYIYRQPHLRPKSQLSKSMYVSSDVAIPPSTSASGQVSYFQYPEKIL